MPKPAIFTKEIIDRYDYPDLSDAEWDSVVDEVNGRLENVLDELLERWVEDGIKAANEKETA
jgi:hypothetical protein